MYLNSLVPEFKIWTFDPARGNLPDFVLDSEKPFRMLLTDAGDEYLYVDFLMDFADKIVKLDIENGFTCEIIDLLDQKIPAWRILEEIVIKAPRCMYSITLPDGFLEACQTTLESMFLHRAYLENGFRWTFQLLKTLRLGVEYAMLLFCLDTPYSFPQV